MKKQQLSPALAAREAATRMQELMRSERCIICCSLVGQYNPVAMVISDLAVCSNAQCIESVHSMRIDLFIGDDDLMI